MAKKLMKKKAVTKTKTKKASGSVDDLVADLAKDFDVEVMSESHEDRTPYFIPFRHKGLQAITGGVPGGRFTEVQGDSQCGKSYLLYELIAECLGMSGYALLHDIERAYEPKYGKRVGIEGDKKFILSKEKTLEQIFLSSRKFVLGVRKFDKNCPILVGIDSYPPIVTMISQKEIDEQLKKGGAKELKGYREAKKNAAFSSQIAEFITFLDEHKATLVLLNQTRKDMGVMFGDPITSNADNIIKFYVTLRLRGRLGKKERKEVGKVKKQIGVRSVWETIKNRKIFPFKKAETLILYKTGINSYSGLADLLETEGIVKKVPKKGLEYNGESFATAKELVKAHPEVLTLE